MVEDMRRELAEGRQSVPAVGAVAQGEMSDLPFVVIDGDGGRLEPVAEYLRDLMLGDASPLTCRSYGFDLLRWHAPELARWRQERRVRRPVRISLTRISGCSKAAKCPPLSASP